ncbi:PASTA domain-containing protein [Tenacibaculum maritimum]|nr:PASTA domain-containing protein [Tenacibaculum maritimum]QCD61787.1 hypothetical protein B9C57_04140 [Tenacibaculum maritimum]
MMSVKYRSLSFQCQLYTAANQGVMNYLIDIEFFNINQGKWDKLQKELPFKEGKCTFLYTIPSRIPRTAIVPRMIRETIASGSMPMFRIVVSGIEKTQIIAEAPLVNIHPKEARISIDFQKLWLLDKALVVNRNVESIIATPVFLGAIEKEQIKLRKEKEKLIEKIAMLQSENEETRSTLKGEINRLYVNLRELRENTNAIKEVLEKKEKEIVALKERLKNNDVINNNAEEVRELRLKIKALTEAIEILKKEYFFLKKEKQQIEATLEKAQNDLIVNQTTIDKLVTQLKEMQASNKDKNHEIKRLLATVKDKDQDLKDLEKRLEEVKSYIDAEHPNKLAAKKVYHSIMSDIAIADKEMSTSRFKLANISMNLKATIEKGPEGTMLGLLDFEAAKQINGAAVSDIHIDIIPNQTTTAKTNTIPNIIGLTETATRKMLTSYGLKLEVVYQPTNDPKLIEGQAIRQSPEAGKEFYEGEEVIVIFAKPLKN